MEKAFFLTAMFLMTAGAGSAAGGVPWDGNRPEFKFFQEKSYYTEDAWNGLTEEEQENSLNEVTEAALRRQAVMQRDYAAAEGKWNSQEARYYTDKVTGKELKAVSLWLGGAKGMELSRKVAVVRAMLGKAATEGISESDAQALAPYLLPESITELRSMKFAAELMEKKKTGVKNRTPGCKSGTGLDKFAKGGPAALDSGKLSKFYDGSVAAGEEAADLSGNAVRAGAKLPGTGAPNATTAKTIKYSAPAALDEGGNTRSAAFTSDAYGITLETGEGTKAFRKTKDAEEAIKKLPDGTIKKVIFYGHGSPGTQNVGPESYDSDSTAALLKGKMSKDGVVQFSGCNTASIGETTLNPAVGLSMAARRLLYFSLPYWQDRADGVPAAQAKEQWEKGWDADLARDTSMGVKGAIVCGYRTFGLVPGRLPLLTRLLGNQEATSPGYVAGKQACYQDGKEVPVP